MKIDKKHGKFHGHESNIITSGGGRFDGLMGKYDRESNTIEVWNGFKRTHIDADKIVSVHSKSHFGAFAFIALWVFFLIFLYFNIGY